ncbi:MAG: ABC transporter substrate-binding protein [Candidatus Binatia bacterium]
MSQAPPVLCFWLFTASLGVFALSGGSPSLAAAAEAKGSDYVVAKNHDEIVTKANKEGTLRVLSSADAATFNVMAKAFNKKYPNIDVYVEEIAGSDAYQRFLLELKGGMTGDWDVYSVSPQFYNELAAYAFEFDVFRMAEENVVAIPLKMVDPKKRNVVGESSTVSSIAYNRKLLAPEKVPNKWEDFLKPEFKDRKFVVDIRPYGFAALVPEMGEEWVRSYARKIKEQNPVWVRGQSRALTAMAAGEYRLHQLTYYHSCVEAARKDPTDSLVCKIIEPVPVRLSATESVLNTAAHPYAALLWLEFQASPVGQKIIDEKEPLKSSIFAPGSELEKITAGKKLSVNDWDTFHLTPKWMQMTVEAFGFPKAEKKG